MEPVVVSLKLKDCVVHSVGLTLVVCDVEAQSEGEPLSHTVALRERVTVADEDRERVPVTVALRHIELHAVLV